MDEHWHVAIEPTAAKRDAGAHDAVAVDKDRDWIERRILEPRRRGETIALSGQTFTWDEVGRLRISVSSQPSKAIIERLKIEDRNSEVFFVGGPGYKERAVYAASDMTDELIDGPPGSLASGAAGVEAELLSDPRAVMVVHGRNEAAHVAMFDFLRALKLNPLEWPTLRAGTGKGTPFVGEILEHAFQRARAVVVLMTPDDEAQLREQFRGDKEPGYETNLTPQARPNVLFEAGMAFGVHPDRTVLVEMGEMRPFSDVGGRHVVRLNGSAEALKDIASRLETAKCDVDTSGQDWMRTSRFAAALESVAAPTSRIAAPEPSHSGQQESSAIHDLLDELASNKMRLERAVREGSYPWNFHLPAKEYHEHKAALSGGVRDAVGQFYVAADDFNRRVSMRGQDGSPVAEDDNLLGLLELLDAAVKSLQDRRTILEDQ